MKIRVCGHVVNIQVHEALRETEERLILQGCADFLDRTIKISATHCVDPIATFLHEYAHWWLVLSGHEMLNETPGAYSQEVICDVIGFSISHLLRENGDILPRFLKFYQAECKRIHGKAAKRK
jgi:hypothetical protein